MTGQIHGNIQVRLDGGFRGIRAKKALCEITTQGALLIIQIRELDKTFWFVNH
ncbi:MAG: hypothetical protein PHD66_02190 [Eubacteriales bacterium]|nr:hypothetical protein [Eubacteriales bacterium]